MFTVLQGLLGGLVGSLAPRVLVGGGLALALAVGLDTLVSSFLSQVVASIGGIPADTLQIMLLAGLGQALSILGGALLTRAALAAALAGVTKA